jgi:hypothetical protein
MMMALCQRQCPLCGNAVTVRIDYSEDCASSDLNGAVSTRAVLQLYDQILDDLADNDQGIAVILNVSGFDVAAKCTRSRDIRTDMIELF